MSKRKVTRLHQILRRKSERKMSPIERTPPSTPATTGNAAPGNLTTAGTGGEANEEVTGGAAGGATGGTTKFGDHTGFTPEEECEHKLPVFKAEEVSKKLTDEIEKSKLLEDEGVVAVERLTQLYQEIKDRKASLASQDVDDLIFAGLDPRLKELMIEQQSELDRLNKLKEQPTGQKEGRTTVGRAEYQKRSKKLITIASKFNHIFQVSMAHFGHQDYLAFLDKDHITDPKSKSFGLKLLAEMEECYKDLEKKRAWVVEPLSEEELADPNIEKYMFGKYQKLVSARRQFDWFYGKQEQNARRSVGIEEAKKDLFKEHINGNQWADEVDQENAARMSTPPVPLHVHKLPKNQNPPPIAASTRHNTPRKTVEMEDDDMESIATDALSLALDHQLKIQAKNHEDRMNNTMEIYAKHQLKLQQTVQDQNYDIVQQCDKFGGNIDKFKPWKQNWDDCYERMKTLGRSELEIYKSLTRVLDGRAKTIAYVEYPDEEAYDTAIKALTQIYEKKITQISMIGTSIVDFKPMKDTVESLEVGIGEWNKAWQQLQKNNLDPKDVILLLFVAFTEKKVSPTTLKNWIKLKKDHEDKTAPLGANVTIEHYFQSMNDALDEIRQTHGKPLPGGPPGSGGGGGFKDWKKRSTQFGGQNTGGSYLTNQEQGGTGDTKNGGGTPGSHSVFRSEYCGICGKKQHQKPLSCYRLKKLDRRELYDIMNKAKIHCKMCLGFFSNEKVDYKHGIQECPGSLKKCTDCAKDHCRFLCPIFQKKRKELREQEEKVEEEKNK